MPQTKTRSNATPRKTASPKTASPKTTPPRRPGSATSRQHARTSRVDRTTELSDDVLKSLESGQRAAIDAVRKFVDKVDETFPALGERPSKRQEIVDSAMEMADRLVHTQYDFLRDVVQSAGKTLGKTSDRK